MSNPLETIGHDIKIGVIDTGKVIVKVVEFLPKAAAVIGTALKDQPEVKTAVLGLVKQATTVIGDVATDAADKGVNLTADAQTLADAEAFFSYFKSTFIPLIESLYTEVSTDLK